MKVRAALFMKAAITTVLLSLAVSVSLGGENPTSQQIRDVELWLNSRDTAEILPAGDRLRAALKTEGESGEALAGYILDAARELGADAESLRRNGQKLAELYDLVAFRAFTYHPGTEHPNRYTARLDVPYLKKLATMSVHDDDGVRFFRDPPAALVYLKFHPEDHEIYWRLRLAATPCAKITEEMEWSLSDRPKEESAKPKPKLESALHALHRPPAYNLKEAWDILIRLEVLRPGMGLEAAKKTLGEPDKPRDALQNPNQPKKFVRYIRWYLNTPRHVNPCLSAEIVDGKIVQFRIGNA